MIWCIIHARKLAVMAGYEIHPVMGFWRIDMKKVNEEGLFPKVLVHRSSFSQLAVGGAMMDRVLEDGYEGESYRCRMSGEGNWRTRFDGGDQHPSRILDLPCDLLAMYAEGQMIVSGCEGAYDWEKLVHPSCYAVVVFRRKMDKTVVEEYTYLRSHLDFTDRICHDGLYDLKNAFEVACNRGPTMTRGERIARFQEIGWAEANFEREWHVINKARVPGRIRQVLHRTVSTVKETVDANFGQGKKFFQNPKTKKR